MTKNRERDITNAGAAEELEELGDEEELEELGESEDADDGEEDDGDDDDADDGEEDDGEEGDEDDGDEDDDGEELEELAQAAPPAPAVVRAPVVTSDGTIAPPPDATHWRAFRRNPETGAEEHMTYGGSEIGVAFEQWAIAEWSMGEMLRRWGPGRYRLFWWRHDGVTQRMRGKTRLFDLAPPGAFAAPQPAPTPRAAVPPPPLTSPASSPSSPSSATSATTPSSSAQVARVAPQREIARRPDRYSEVPINRRLVRRRNPMGDAFLLQNYIASNVYAGMHERLTWMESQDARRDEREQRQHERQLIREARTYEMLRASMVPPAPPAPPALTPEQIAAIVRETLRGSLRSELVALGLVEDGEAEGEGEEQPEVIEAEPVTSPATPSAINGEPVPAPLAPLARSTTEELAALANAVGDALAKMTEFAPMAKDALEMIAKIRNGGASVGGAVDVPAG